MKIVLSRRRVRALLISLIVLLALLQRIGAACNLPVDADEPVYNWAASYYAGLMARGEWAAIPHYNYNSEHPALFKLIYAVNLRLVGYQGWPDQPAALDGTMLRARWGDPPSALSTLVVNRYVSVLLGTLQVLVVALVNPLAGALLAAHTMTVKYTAEVYLEALPALAVTCSMLAYDRARRRGEGATGGWFWLSAALLGVAAAGKYIYAVVGLTALPFVVWQQRRRPWNVLLYGLLALAVFFALDPTLWPDPLGRLLDSLRYHQSYARGSEVARAAYPWWQPLLWMGGASSWHPAVFFFPFDIFTFLFSLVGLPFLYRRNKLLFAWYVGGWLFLFLWPTRWPQYTLIVTPALCFSVGAIAETVSERYNIHLDAQTWERLTYWLPADLWIAPPRWLVIALLALSALCGLSYAVVRVRHALELRHWTTWSVTQGSLPDNRVTALALDGSGRVWVGTPAGLAIDEAGQFRLLRAANSPLPDNQVTVLARDAAGRMWVGSESGVCAVAGEAWDCYTAADMGLPEARVRALAADGRGWLWVGTRAGLAVWDGAAWQNAGDFNRVVLSLTVDTGGRVWIGTDQGLVVHDPATGAWSNYTAFSSGLTANGVRALAADPQGGVWVGTGGGGLCHFDLATWACYSTANSDIPWNTVAALAVDAAGRVWVATEKPLQGGGAVAVFDGADWRSYTPTNSGLAHGQVSAILQDGEGRLWFGTQFAGLSVYDESR